MFDDAPENFIQGYFYETNIYSKDVEKIGIEFKIEKDFLEKENFDYGSLFVLNEEWLKVESVLYEEDEGYFYYRGFIGM